MEVNIWQALGDAYMRANRLKEALESYNKAEELIR
ncbi:MAG: tetratricopeptide repeat protein [Anaerolineales bacterium]|nr:tetratricopeptide repeat protein [Anaerolineales bacterium]